METPSAIIPDYQGSAEIPNSIYVPKGTNGVAKSKHFKEIIDRICSGWHPAKLERWLRTECNEYTVTEGMIRGYMKNYIPVNLIHYNSHARAALQEFEAKVDEVGILEKLILDQQERVSALLEQEVQEGAGKVRPLKDEMELLTKMVISSVKVKQSLGMMDEIPDRTDGATLAHGMSDNDKREIPMQIADKVLRYLSSGGVESVIMSRD